MRLIDVIQRQARPIVSRRPDQLAGDDLAPGTLVWLPAGRYTSSDGWRILQRGAREAPITIEPEPGAEVTLELSRPWRSALEAGLLLQGCTHVRVQSGELGGLLRITNADDTRCTDSMDTGVSRPPGIDILGSSGVTVRNVLIDNCGNGVLANAQSHGLTVSGVVSTRNGWDAPATPAARGRGHAYYLQAPSMLVEGCYAGYGYGANYQFFGSALDLDGLRWISCASVQAHAASMLELGKQACTIGSEQTWADTVQVRDLVLWQSSSVTGGGDRRLEGGIALGSNTAPNGLVSIRGCLLNGQTAWRGPFAPIDWRANRQHGWVRGGGQTASLAWGLWRPDYQQRLGEYAEEFAAAHPDAEYVFGHYDGPLDVRWWSDAGSGWHTVRVASGAPLVAVDVAPPLAVGDRYEVRRCAEAERVIAAGVYDGGPLSLPMSAPAVAPVGGSIPSVRNVSAWCESFLVRQVP